jgi:hypothetical protein
VPLQGRLSRDHIVGRVLSAAELGSTIGMLSNVWLTHVHNTDGRVGWYRVLNRSDRIGNFATAQGVVALNRSGVLMPEIDAVIRGLLATRLPSGGWAFMSTLTEVDVVDATAWVLMALAEYQHEPTLDGLKLPQVIDATAERLSELRLPDGGWGIVAGGTFRAYSTALAVRALCRAGRERSIVVQRGIQALLANVDKATGAWSDSSGRVSIAVTAEVVRALRQPTASRQRNALEADRAARWLLSLADSSRLWTTGQFAATTEEIEIGVGTARRRVDFSFAPRTAAVLALLESGHGLAPPVVHALVDILQGAQTNDWQRVAGPGRDELTSWLLADTCAVTTTLRDQLPPPTGEVWANRRRVVVSNAGEPWVIRFARRRWVGLTLLAVSVLVAVLLGLGGVVDGFGLAAAAFVLSSVALGVLTNLVSEYLVGSGQ